MEFEFTSDVKSARAIALHSVIPTTKSIKIGDQSSFERWQVACYRNRLRGLRIVATKRKQEEYDSLCDTSMCSVGAISGSWCSEACRATLLPERRQELSRFSDLRFKAMAARDRGAAGLIVVSGPTSQVRNELVPLSIDGTLGTSSISVISVSNNIAAQWFKLSEMDLAEEQKSLDNGEMAMGVELKNVKWKREIDIEPVNSRGRTF